MAQPTAYQRSFNFSPLAPANVPEVGARLEDEFDALERTTDEIRNNLELIQRDDGRLRNQAVHPESLSARVRAIIAGGWSLKGPWTTATAYQAKDVVSEDGVLYVCVEAHVAGTFATDLAAELWLEFYSENVLPGPSSITFSMLSTSAITELAAAVAVLLPQPPTIEVGSVFAYVGDTAPPGYLLAFGQVLEQADHAQLFARMGTRFNTGGEGPAQFRMPDFRGRALVGRDNMGGTAANRLTAAVCGFDATVLGAAGVGGDQRLHAHGHGVNDPGHGHSTSAATSPLQILGSSAEGGLRAPGDATANGVAFAAGTSSAYFTRPEGVESNAISGPGAISTASATTGLTVQNSGSGAAQNVQPSAVVNWIVYRGQGETSEGVVAPHAHDIEDVTGLQAALDAKASATVAKTERIGIACSDEVTNLTTGAAKVTFRMPYAMTLTAVRASLTTASSSGVVEVDVNEGGVSIFSTRLTIDANERTSTTAATAAVISDTALADDAEITIDIDAAGTGARGLKVWLIGTRA